MLQTSPTTGHSLSDFDKTYPTFETFAPTKTLSFPEDLKDVKVGGLKSKVDVEMSFMKVIFSEVFANTLYGAGIKDCKLVRYNYKKEKLVCRSRLGNFSQSNGFSRPES
jgi:hypothetical protein